MQRFLLFIDVLNAWVGKCFGWLILVLTFGISYEVFVRYVLRAPTTWAFDIAYITYGALFLMAGAYTLSRGGHVRADFLYRLWKPETQATVDLVLYFLFFFPGVIALMYSGWNFASMSVRFREVSIFSPAGVPVFPLKSLIPVAGTFLFAQGVAEVIRCVICLQTGRWPQKLSDVEEMETAILHEKQFQQEQSGAKEA
jgi:TRAP-type mannitol/chloroaromatic compound transport system permease small subunit